MTRRCGASAATAGLTGANGHPPSRFVAGFREFQPHLDPSLALCSPSGAGRRRGYARQTVY